MSNLLRELRTWLSLIAILASTPSMAQQRMMHAVASKPGPNLHIVLVWPNQGRFNLYRKVSSSPVYPLKPINTNPIQPVTDQAKLKVLIAPGSEEWEVCQEVLGGSGAEPFDPGSIPASSPKAGLLQLLAGTYWRIAVAIGQGFFDKGVVSGNAYTYELRQVDPGGAESTLYTGVTMTAGSPEHLPGPPRPPGLSATSGDSRVLLQWENVPGAASFAIYRSGSASGPWLRINDSFFMPRISTSRDARRQVPSSFTFVDYQRWDASGNAAIHRVKDHPVDGPFNDSTYFYRVVSVDLLGSEWGSEVSKEVTPKDTTPPATPGNVRVTPVDSQGSLEVSWNIVEFDTAGHAESPGVTLYRVARYERPNIPGSSLGAAQQDTWDIPAPPRGRLVATFKDQDSVLRQRYGEKTFYYRVQAIDSAGNSGAFSIAAPGHLKDITAPAPVMNLKAEGFDDHISLSWALNGEPDMDGYEVYRSLCDYGTYPCTSPKEPSGKATRYSSTEYPSKAGCEPFQLLGSLTQKEAQTLAAAGSPLYVDHSVPSGSPLCYAYWVKALDHAQNASGGWPFPWSNDAVVCQRLQDRTPPEPAILSGLSARDGGILVEWIGPPIQDIKAYHVYRSEREDGAYAWVGGMTVATPPVELTTPYRSSGTTGCTEIPRVSVEGMSSGSWLDQKVQPKKIYWYKVVGIDQSGNEADVRRAAPASTFTFSTKPLPSPSVATVTPIASPVGLLITWIPTFDPAQQRGFAIFRSSSPGGTFLQIGSVVTGNEYQDFQVIHGVEYWYKVLQVDTNGHHSSLSTAKSGRLAH